WDPKNYPLGTKKELTREIYTDIKGSPDGSTKNIDSVSQELLPQPRLFTYLQQLDINTEQYSQEVDTYDFWGSGGVNARYKYINGTLIVGINQSFNTTLGATFQHP
ncbi:hypothetical protein ABE42_08300, partial [Bacillus thuringiensis]|nr:hypothetical protein [Bacillus thuringiensis]